MVLCDAIVSPIFLYEETEAPRGNFRDVCVAVYTQKKYMSYVCQVGELHSANFIPLLV